MFRLHCNKCGQLQASDPKRSFVISRCQHIVCDICIALKKNTCPVCQRPFQGTPINGNMSIHVARYFENPRPLLDMWKKISKFQHDQVASDNIHFWHRQQNSASVKRDLEDLNKLSAELTSKNEREKQKINKILNYISYCERALEKNIDLPNQTFHSLRELEVPNTPSSMSTDNTTSDENIRTLINISLDSNDSGGNGKLSRKRRRSANDILNESFF